MSTNPKLNPMGLAADVPAEGAEKHNVSETNYHLELIGDQY